MNRNLLLYCLLFFLTCVFPVQNSLAQQPPAEEELPLWEFGLAPIWAQIPHYRGSDEHENYAFAVPYFVYRGEIFKSDRDGVRGIFWRNEKFETDVSLSGNPPVSDENTAREGLPELDPLMEIGPALKYYFEELGEFDAFFLQAGLRFATSVDTDDLSTGYEGIVADLNLIYKNSRLLKKEKIRFHLSTGIQFGSAEYHSYFYDVEEQYATTDRPAYESEQGYAGFQISGSLMKELTPALSIGAYARYINTEGAAFDNSPLFKEAHNYAGGILLLWTIAESDKMIQSKR